jgi:leucyl aminopeptidase
VTDPFARADQPSCPVYTVYSADLSDVPEPARAWARTMGYTPAPGRLLAVPDANGELSCLLIGQGSGKAANPLIYGTLPREAPKGTYHLVGIDDPQVATFAALGFGLSAYEFNRYKSDPVPPGVWLVPPAQADMVKVRAQLNAVALTRDLINTPAEDMGPEQLARAAMDLARHHSATARVIRGDDLLVESYPLIHAVGRASSRPPCLVDFSWGKPDAPKVTLVGKGVCFDTGGLDIKPSSGMALMKKDMGGAANVLGLASMIMEAGLNLRLRVLLPIVENNIAGNAFRTSDVFKSRKGLSVEIGNTDAEGRLILADALAEADSEAPALLIDLATLTGAARVALGADVPPFYTDDETLACELARASIAEHDPVWRLPLVAHYAKGLDSRIADIKSTSDGGLAGSIIAALFLQKFVVQAEAWLHADIFAWSPEARPGKPHGGEAQAIRALYAVIAARYPA